MSIGKPYPEFVKFDKYASLIGAKVVISLKEF